MEKTHQSPEKSVYLAIAGMFVIVMLIILGFGWLVSQIPEEERSVEGANADTSLCFLFQYSPIQEVPVKCLKELTK